MPAISFIQRGHATPEGIPALRAASADAVVERAEELGATQMIFHSPYTCWSAHNNDCIGVEDARTLTWAMTRLTS